MYKVWSIWTRSLRFRAQLKHRCRVIGTSKHFDKSTEKKSLEANEKFTLSKNAVATALICFLSQDAFGSHIIIKAVQLIIGEANSLKFLPKWRLHQHLRGRFISWGCSRVCLLSSEVVPMWHTVWRAHGVEMHRSGVLRSSNTDYSGASAIALGRRRMTWLFTCMGNSVWVRSMALTLHRVVTYR